MNDNYHHGHGLNASRLDMTGNEFGTNAAGRVKFILIHFRSYSCIVDKKNTELERERELERIV
jgi:hypothetical protein